MIKYLPLLNQLITLPFTQTELNSISKLTKEETQQHMNEIIKSIIEHRSCQNPMLIILEDLQWMDISSIRVFDHVASTVHSLLIVATTRELTDLQRQQFSNLFCLDRTTHLPLEPLSHRDCENIIMKHVFPFLLFLLPFSLLYLPSLLPSFLDIPFPSLLLPFPTELYAPTFFLSFFVLYKSSNGSYLFANGSFPPYYYIPNMEYSPIHLIDLI